jgi:uncharacterized protein YoxC
VLSPVPTDIPKPRTRSLAEASKDTVAKAKANKYKIARKFLDTNGLLTEEAPCTPMAMASVLLLMSKYKMPENIVKALEHAAEITQHIETHCQGCNPANNLSELLDNMQTELSADLNKKLDAIEHAVKTPPPAQDQLSNVAKEISQVAKSIKMSLSEMGSSLAKVTDTNSHLENTASTYRDALRNDRLQQLPAQSANLTSVDPRVIREVDRKARQILIETKDETIMGASLAEIKEKVCTAIETVSEPLPPKDMTIVEIGKLRNGGITILFKEKEVLKWLSNAATELTFTAGLAPDASIRQRQYTILVPRIPLTFDPSSEGHLREVEENNNMPEGTLLKARWIKPVNRHAPEQRAVHAAFTLRDISTTNSDVQGRAGLNSLGLGFLKR